MSSQKVNDVQDLLRLLTSGRNKITMMAAMGRVKALQSANLHSISEIASSDLPTLTTAITDPKASKSLLAACKAHIKSGALTPGQKRPSTTSLSSTTKRQKSAYELSNEPQTPAELEASLELPQPSVDEEEISQCTIYTNRAPLVLAFAVQLLKYTMPEQPLSSRLSLAQAVVSANSRSKAVSLGIEKGKAAEEEGWGKGQPKVKIMGREITVLKRSGYEWKEKEPESERGSNPIPEIKEENTIKKDTTTENQSFTSASTSPLQSTSQTTNTAPPTWTKSTPVTLKKSTFLAHSIPITSPSAFSASTTLTGLFALDPTLQTASHNITASRILLPSGHIHETSNSDGENGGGPHLLSILQKENLTNIFLVVSRWYGGIMLGSDRWRIINQVCLDCLSQRLRISGTVEGGTDPLWGLDLEKLKTSSSSSSTPTSSSSRFLSSGDNLPIHRPEGARLYLLKSFPSPPPPSSTSNSSKKKSRNDQEYENEMNLGCLLGALDLLFSSWVGHVGKEELDRRAWGWYVRIRPDVEHGPAGWGGKGGVQLGDILKLRREDKGEEVLGVEGGGGPVVLIG